MCQLIEIADIETASDNYASRFSGEVGEYFLDEQLKKVLNIIKMYEKPTILDVGGGHAQLAIPLVNQGYRVTITGSDAICEQRLKRELTAGSYSFYVCDILNLPYSDMSFDIVLAFRLLPHVEKWEALIDELSRVAKRAVIVDYPDYRSSNILNTFLFNTKKSIEGNTRPFSLFSRKQIADAFDKNDFKVENFYPEFLLPMVLHRKLGSASLSKFVENISQLLKLTTFFGSPIVTHLRRN